MCQASLAVCKALVNHTLTLVVLASEAASKKCPREEVAVQLRGMYLMIGAALKSEYGQVVLKAQYQ